MITITVKPVAAGSFTMYAVIVNGTELKRWWSEEKANDHKKRCMIAWNIEKIGARK